MSDEAKPWPVFNLQQRRVLGVLVEKAKTTPDAYPLTLNALANGSNQKSNRDPLLDFNDDDVAAAMRSLLPLGLVTRITGSRVERWRHNLYDVWAVDKVELAILAELLLRGPQSEGELRTRAGRMDPIDSLEILREKLKPLRERGLIQWLGEEGRRGSQITHGFHAQAELEALRQRVRVDEPLAAARPPTPAPVSVDVEMQLREEIAGLRLQVEHLAADLQSLKHSLGA
jgi:uncharacterized protein YceH (UPF0502 family)